MQRRLASGCKRTASGCVSGNGDRGEGGDGERDLRLVCCWSSMSGSCVSGDVIGDRGVWGDGLRAYRVACCLSGVSGSCVSGDSGGKLGGGGCAYGMVFGCGIGLKTGSLVNNSAWRVL